MSLNALGRAAALAARRQRSERRRADLLAVLRIVSRSGRRLRVTPGKLRLALILLHNGAPPYAHRARGPSPATFAASSNRSAPRKTGPRKVRHLRDISGSV